MSRYMIQETHHRIHPHRLDYSSTRHRTTGYEPLRLSGNRPSTLLLSFVAAEVNIVTEKHLRKLNDCPRIPLSVLRGLLDVSHIVRETAITDDGNTRSGSCEMSSATITITKFDCTNYTQWATEMALLLEQKQMYCIIKGYDDKPEEPPANETATEKAAFKDWMNRHGIG